jgi:hypothetical protein
VTDPLTPKVSKREWIGRIIAAALVAALFVAGVYAMESDPAPDAPRGPAG